MRTTAATNAHGLNGDLSGMETDMAFLIFIHQSIENINELDYSND